MTTAKECQTISQRGCGKYDVESGKFLFQPQGKGEPQQKNVRTVGRGGNRSKFYETEGEKDASVVAHLVAKKKSADPVADLLRDFVVLTGCDFTRLPQLPPMAHARNLLNTEKLQIVADGEKREVVILSRLTYDEARRPARPLTLLDYYIQQALGENFDLFYPREGR